MNEQLSAFLDNEATRDETDSVINSLLRDEALRDSWTRQHWIRTTLRSHSAEPGVNVDTGFANRVMSAIADDETRTPVPHPQTTTTRHNVAGTVARVRRRRWRGIAGMAAAASVAGVVFLAGNPLPRGGSPGAQNRVAVAKDSASAAAADDAADIQRQGFASGDWNSQLADFSSVAVAPAQARTVAVSAGSATTGGAQGSRDMVASNGSTDHWSVSDPAVRDELNGYLVDHNGMARGYGMSSTTPALVRVAAYGQDMTQ